MHHPDRHYGSHEGHLQSLEPKKLTPWASAAAAAYPVPDAVAEPVRFDAGTGGPHAPATVTANETEQ